MNHIGRQIVKYWILLPLVFLLSCNEDDTKILVASIEITGDYITDGMTTQLSVEILPENASNQSVSWSVSDESIATISTSGLLTAVSNGNVTITVEAQDNSGIKSTRLIGVNGVYEEPVLVNSISIEGDDIIDGKASKFSAVILPVDASDQEVAWSVSDETMASINQAGMLTPKRNGMVTLSALAQDGSNVSGELIVNIAGVNESIEGTIVATSEELLDAINNASPGEFIYVRGGNYSFSSTIKLNRNGQDGNVISLIAYPADADRPVLDFSTMTENSSNRGISLSADHWHLKGFDIFKAGDNGLNISGNNNIIEFCAFSENRDTGLQLGNGAANNIILNCDSYFNADATLENADGFASKLNVGSGNKFIGCRAWQNLDDGWDGYLRDTDNITTYYENCWAIKNGILKSGEIGAGDGNGFKTGGSDNKQLKHHALLSNCIAAGNTVDGFDHNSNRGEITLLNCTSHFNGRNINFGSGNIADALTIKNTVSFDGGSSDSYNAVITDITNNSWQNGILVNSDDFESLDIESLLSPRNPDGSLPDINYMKLKANSDLIDKGIDVGLEFSGSAPDIGVFEWSN